MQDGRCPEYIASWTFIRQQSAGFIYTCSDVAHLVARTPKARAGIFKVTRRAVKPSEIDLTLTSHDQIGRPVKVDAVMQKQNGAWLIADMKFLPG